MARFRAIVITKTETGTAAALTDFDEAGLMEGDVTLRPEWSTVNYKDGLAITGKAPVVRRFPMIAGVDAAARSSRVDGTRVGIRGHSYGGYMAMFAVTQTRRFKAAMASAGISNWLSYIGQNKIDQWMLPYFGASVYDDPAVYAKSAPIEYIKNVKTPTLVVVGDRDGECPAPQSYEFWHALRDLGVKTEMVVYPNEGHAFHTPEHQKDVLVRTIVWFNENLK